MNSTEKPKRTPKPKKEKNSTSKVDTELNNTENEVGFQIYRNENEALSYKDCKKQWKSLDDVKKKTFIDKILDQNNNRRKHILILKNNEQSDVKEDKSEKTYTPSKITMEIQRLIGLPASYSFQPGCYSCEKHFIEYKTVRCASGKCSRYVHPQCSVTVDNKNFCKDCAENKAVCAFCRNIKNNENKLVSCDVEGCLRQYHKPCLGLIKNPYLTVKNSSVKICPAHFCITCVQEKGKFHQCYSKNLVECIRCSNSYHLYDLCMVAGAVEVSLSNVICPRHFQSTLIKDSYFSTVNVNVCVTCCKSTPDVKCIYCPNSYHADCIGDSNKASKNTGFICDDCINQHNPRVASVQLVKLHQYRWWPCEVIHMRNGPYNLVRRGWVDGALLVRFLGSDEYQFISKSRCLPYNVGLKIGLLKDISTTSKFAKQFKAGLKEAAKIHQVYVNIVKRFVPLSSMSADDMDDGELESYINYDEEKDTSSPVFEFLSTNKPAGEYKGMERMSVPVCGCSVEDEGYCETKTLCSNYAACVQCDKGSCVYGDKCRNQLFFSQKHKNDIGVFKTHNRGHGLTVLVDLTTDEFIHEYAGELITEKDALAILKKSHNTNFYMIKLDNNTIVDAGSHGNLTRFINHSCSPNCYVQRWLVDGYYRLGIFALRAIKSNEELTISYHDTELLMPEDQFCLCNSFNCVGYLKKTVTCLSSNSNSSVPVTGSPKLSHSHTKTPVSTPIKSSKSLNSDQPSSPRITPAKKVKKDKSVSMGAVTTTKTAPKTQTANSDNKKDTSVSMGAVTTTKTAPKTQTANSDNKKEKSVSVDAVTTTTTPKTQTADSDKKKSPVTTTNHKSPAATSPKRRRVSMRNKPRQVLKVGEIVTPDPAQPLQESASDIPPLPPLAHKHEDEQNLDEDGCQATESVVTEDDRPRALQTEPPELKEAETIVITKKPPPLQQNTSPLLPPSKDLPPNTEGECFRCFDGGQLLMCDKKWCPKSYHTTCLGLKSKPKG